MRFRPCVLVVRAWSGLGTSREARRPERAERRAPRKGKHALSALRGDHWEIADLPGSSVTNADPNDVVV